MKIKFEVVGSLALLSLWWCAIASAQDLQKHVVYVCNGEKIMIDTKNNVGISCTIRRPRKFSMARAGL